MNGQHAIRSSRGARAAARTRAFHTRAINTLLELRRSDPRVPLGRHARRIHPTNQTKLEGDG